MGNAALEDLPLKKGRVFGEVVYAKTGYWYVEGEPHLLIRLKRIFPRSNQQEYGRIGLKDTRETCQELLWVMTRWALKISPSDLKYMKRQSAEHSEGLVRLEKLVDPNYKPKPVGLEKPAREYQLIGAEIWKEKRGVIIGDDVGLGKTITAITGFIDPALRPCVVVCQAGNMPFQWMKKIHEFAPKMLVHIVETMKLKPIPKFMGRSPDVIILTYHKLTSWTETLAHYAKSLVFDEIQELRRHESAKYNAAKHLADHVPYKVGLTATPIYNYGDEIHNIVSILNPDALGTREEFLREWTVGDKVVGDPKALGTYLRENFIMLRRTRAEVGRELPKVERIIYDIDSDKKALEAVQGRAAALANIILKQAEARGADVHKGREIGEASRELDRLMRQATGIAKAPFVAEFLKMLVESGERPVVFAWHREVYSILSARLEEAGIKSVMYTGTESPKQKKRNLEQFIGGEADVLLMSLRAGAGIDGLQHASRTAVVAELDWSPGVHTQCIGRIDRDGQTDPVQAYFLVSNVGSDPTVAEVIGIKEEQSEGIRNPENDNIEELQADPKRIRRLAESVLNKKPAPVQESDDE